MVTFVVYLILIYQVASFFFFRKSKYYYFQRYLYTFFLQSVILIFFIEGYSWESLFLMHLQIWWAVLLFVLFSLYVCQIPLSLLKMFPDIFTLEWWEAFHRYNIYNFLRVLSTREESSISNLNWLTNQKNHLLYTFVRTIKIIRVVVKTAYFLLFLLLLKNCWYIEPELVWFQIDYFIFIYWRFFILIPFIFLFIHSIFFNNIRINHYLLILNIKAEGRMLDKAYFDPNFGFSLSIENAEEYMRYSYQVLFLITGASNKKSDDGTYEVNLMETTDVTRLVWDDSWWDCNNYYYSRAKLNKKYSKKYKNKWF